MNISDFAEPAPLRDVLGYLVPGAVTVLALAFVTSPVLGRPPLAMFSSAVWDLWALIHLSLFLALSYVVGNLQVRLVEVVEGCVDRSARPSISSKPYCTERFVGSWRSKAMGKGARTDKARVALQAQLEGMGSVKYSDAEYYCLTLTGSGDGRICWAAQSVFAGWTDTRPKREMRVPCKVDPTKMLDLLTSIGQACLVVNELPDLLLYLRLGGHAIIRADLAEQYLPDLLELVEVARSTHAGYVTVGGLPRSKLLRASRGLRRRVLKRDGYCCRACGRSRDNHVDIEMHVHHIRPWGGGLGGLTEEDNLITLCNTCHGGLDPHFDLALYSHIGVDPFRIDMGEEHRELIEGIESYRAIVRALHGEENSECQ